MKTIATTLATVAEFSDDNTKRYLLRKVWNEKLPSLAVIMLTPSEASGIELDTTTQLVINNAARLGYGSIAIVNLFATLNDFNLRLAEAEDSVNMEAILKAVKDADQVVYAPGTGKTSSKVFQQRQSQVLQELKPYEIKLCCLCNEEGNSRLQHPLAPALRTWYLSPLKVSELLNEPTEKTPVPKEKAKTKTTSTK